MGPTYSGRYDTISSGRLTIPDHADAPVAGGATLVLIRRHRSGSMGVEPPEA